MCTLQCEVGYQCPPGTVLYRWKEQEMCQLSLSNVETPPSLQDYVLLHEQ